MDDIVGLRTPAIPQELLVLPRMSPACSVVVCLFVCLLGLWLWLWLLFFLFFLFFLFLLLLLLFLLLLILFLLCWLCDSWCCFSALQPSDYTVFVSYLFRSNKTVKYVLFACFFETNKNRKCRCVWHLRSQAKTLCLGCVLILGARTTVSTVFCEQHLAKTPVFTQFWACCKK